jgi:hypothetical protein
VKITVPESGISGDSEITLITARANSDSAICHTTALQTRFHPYLQPKKSVSPEVIFINGTGYNEIATIKLEVVGSGFGVPSYKPQDIVFTVDRSNSMLPSEIDMAKQAILEFIDNMSVPDRGAVVHFDSEVVLMNSLTSNYIKLKKDVNDIPGPGQKTYMGEALLEALIELNANGQEDKVHVIILITDGAWNGDLDPITVAQWARENQTFIFTIGLGDGAYNIILKEIADITGAENFTAETIDEFRAVYDKIAHFMDKTAGYDPDPDDLDPMIRDVLPPWIDYIPGSFSKEPDSIYVNATGYTFLEWNMDIMFIGETWKVTFNITSSKLGFQEANNYSSSRVNYINWEDLEIETLFPKTNLIVQIQKPLPPRLSLEVVDDLGIQNGRGDNILLSWEAPPSPNIAYYLIYRSDHQRGFDFQSPWIRTDVHDDNGIIPTRTTLNDTFCAKVGDSNYNQQMYYVIKAVNEGGIESITSETVGKWTREFVSGRSTFSLPLRPAQTHDVHWYVQDMNADYIKWMNDNHIWSRTYQDQISGKEPNVIVGEGYEVKFSNPTQYTFCGYPGSMIIYDGDLFGFDTTEASSLSASVDNQKTVTLSWVQPQNIDIDNRLLVLRANSRAGFWGVPSMDYQEIGDLPPGTTSIQDPGIAQINTRYYYLVVPVNTTSDEWGSSSYSIGIWTKGYDRGYDTISVPLKLDMDRNADWYCDAILHSWGINYFEVSESRWIWHKKAMPQGVYDTEIIMARGYQISTQVATSYSFVGI